MSIIAIDLDNTLVDTNIAQKVFKKYNIEYYPANDWEMTNYPDHIKHEIFDIYNNPDRKIMTSLEPFSGVRGTLRYLKSKGHSLIIVTSRNGGEIDRQWIKSLFPMIDDIRIVGSGCSKYDELIRIKANYYIDDHITFDCFGCSFTTFLISNDDTPYNYDSISMVDHVLKNFNQIINYL